MNLTFHLESLLMLAPLPMLVALITAHFLFDYPLQGDFLSKAKNPRDPILGVPWYQAMTAHCFIHASAVYFITGNWRLGVGEFVLHFATDYLKCQKKLSYNADQAIHLWGKLCWWIAIMLSYMATTPHT